MRIALISDFYLPSLGGAQTSILNQKRTLKAAGHEVFLFVSRYNAAEPTDDDHTVRIPSLYIKTLDFPIIKPTKRLIKQLGDYFEQHNVEVVHAQTEFGLGRAAATAAKDKGILCLYTVHTFSWETKYPMPTVLARIVRLLHKAAFGGTLPLLKRQPGETQVANALKSYTFLMAQQCDGIICPSQHVAEALRGAGAIKPIAVIPNPVVLPAAIKPEPLPQIPRFVWPSRCRPEKRILEFIRACLAAQKLTKHEFYVDIVGDGPLLQAAKALAKGNNNIVFHGRLPAAASLKLISKGSIVALSSHNFDNQPMVVAEAMRLSRGVLYCDDKLREGLDTAGYLTKPDPKAIAAGIADLVEHPKKIVRLSRAAKQASYQFSPEYYNEQLQAIIKKLSTK